MNSLAKLRRIFLGAEVENPDAPPANPLMRPVTVDFQGSVWSRLRTAAGIITGRIPNADAVPAAGIVAQDSAALLYARDGANWTRLSIGVDTGADNADGAARALNVISKLKGLVGTAWQPLRAEGLGGDALANTGSGLVALAVNAAYNGAAYDRLRTASASVQSSATQTGILAVAGVGNWSAHADPAVNVVATATRAAGGAGVRHVCTSIAASLSAGGTASGIVKVYLRDGAAGVGAILWSANLVVPIGTARNITLSGLSIPGSANAAMTLEFSAAGGATTQENVALTGYSVA